MKKKNLIIGIVGFVLVSSGLVYQNCGQLNESGSLSPSGEDLSMQGLNEIAKKNVSSTSKYFVKMSDGTQVVFQSTQDMGAGPYFVKLTDGTQIKFEKSK